VSIYAGLAKMFRLGEPLTEQELRTLLTLAAANGNHRLERQVEEALEGKL